MTNINQFKKILKFYFQARTINNIHSKNVFDMVRFIFSNKVDKYFYNRISKYRRALKKNFDQISIQDYGAGSIVLSTSIKKNVAICDIYNSAVSPSFKCNLIHNIAAYLKPKQVLELGTSLGLTSLYLAQGGEGHVITIEGDQAIAEIAQQQFSKFDLNIESVIGKFDDLLADLLQTNDFGLIYIDGNHTYEATIRYFELIKEYYQKRSFCILFDDIYWSQGMIDAWTKIKADQNVTLSIDFYVVGLVMVNDQHFNPKHYKVIQRILKPFEFGFSPIRG